MSHLRVTERKASVIHAANRASWEESQELVKILLLLLLRLK